MKRQHIEVEIQVEPDPKKKPKPGDVGPFVVNLASAAPDARQEESWRFQVYGDEHHLENNTPLYLISGQPGANLIGSTKAPPQTAADKATYAVGVYNRKHHTLKLAGAAGGCVVRVEAQAVNVTDAEVAGLKPAVTQQQRQPRATDLASRRADNRKLVEAFGSTRRKRQLKQREEGAVVVDRNADEERLALLMEEVAARATAAGETRQEVMAKVGAARVVPAHDPKARLPHQAYQVKRMFPDALLAALNVGQLLHAAEKAEDRERLRSKSLVPAYVLSRLQRISDAGNNVRERKQRARLLALLAALLQLAAARSKLSLKPPRPAKEEGGKERPGGLEELAWSLKISRKDVLEPLLGMFYNKSVEGGTTVYVREDFKQQLLVMHVLVVALDLEGWTMAPVQFDDLKRELKMNASEVVSRFRELGCTCTAVKLAPGIAADGTPTPAVGSYTVALLPGGTKTLEESFPKAKTGPKQRGGR